MMFDNIIGKKCKKIKYKKIKQGKVYTTGKKYIGIYPNGSFVVVGKKGVVASYGSTMKERAISHFKRLK